MIENVEPHNNSLSAIDLAALIEQIAAPIALETHEPRIAYANPAFLKLLKLEAIPAAPISVIDLLHAAGASETTARGTPGTSEWILPSGRVISAQQMPFQSTGSSKGTLWQFSDVTNQRQSEARYRAIIENIEDGYYEVDINGHFVFVNDGLCRIAGCQREELLAPGQRHYSHHFSEATAAKLLELFRSVLRSRKPVQGAEVLIERPDGSNCHVEFSVALVDGPEGRLTGFCGIARDISKRKQVEAALDRRVTLLSVLEQVDLELSQTLDTDQVLSVAFNAAVLLSHADAGFIGLAEGDRLRLVRLVGPYGPVQQVEANIGIVGRVMRQRRAELIPDVSADPDYYCNIPSTRAQITIPLISHDKLLGVINLETADPERFTPETFEFVQLVMARAASAIDNARLYAVSQQQLAELRELYAQLQELEQLKSDMIRIAAHDMRSPLGILTGYLDILRFDLKDLLTDEQRSYFDSMLRAIDRIRRMTTDILSLEWVQAAREPLTTIINLADVVSRAVFDCADEARQKGHNVVVQIERAVNVYGDAISLVEATGNLLGNAIKYTPESGTIEVRLRTEGARAIVEVVDNGYGIPEEYHDQLFQPFFRVRIHETLDIDGTGLGLYLVRKIIDRHGGQMHFKSAPGVGSTFGFSLPLAELEA
ncbi:MAG: ATP-binding protein [Aggregatilineales bacterium]